MRRDGRASNARRFAACAREFAGLDILVANAGIATSAPLEETTVELWRKNYNVLAEGTSSRRAPRFPLMKLQRGGSIIHRFENA